MDADGTAPPNAQAAPAPDATAAFTLNEKGERVNEKGERVDENGLTKKQRKKLRQKAAKQAEWERKQAALAEAATQGEGAAENNATAVPENESPNKEDAADKKAKRKRKKKRKKKKAGDSASGSKPCPSRLIGGCTDYYTKYGQTEPPTKPVRELSLRVNFQRARRCRTQATGTCTAQLRRRSVRWSAWMRRCTTRFAKRQSATARSTPMRSRSSNRGSN